MRLKKTLVLIVVLLSVSLMLASCGNKSETKTIVIGLTAPLSGSGAGYGEDIKAGLDMAIKKVNDAGGITVGGVKYNFKLDASDDAMVPEQALTNANQFVLEQGINTIWDPTANTIQPLLGVNTKAGEEFLIMAYSSVPLYASAPNKLMVTLPPPFSVYLGPFIKMAMTKGWLKVGMLQTTGAYGDLWGSTFEKAWTGAGGQVVAKAPASYYTETDFTPYLTTVLAANPDVIFCGGPSDPTALVIQQARGLGFKGGFIVIDQAKLDAIAAKIGMDKLEGAIGVLPVELGANTWPYMSEFAANYKAEYGKTVTWETAICYTGFNILAKAIEAGGSVDDVNAIRAGFAEGAVSVTSGDQYPVAFSGIDNNTGALLMPGTATQVKDGKFTQEVMIEWWKK
jgi:branched-chain amino acid transport system substrate-binding protein